MERERLDLWYLRKIIFIFLVLVLAGTWLMDFFFDEKFSEPIYAYFEFWLYIISLIVIGILFYTLDSSARKNKVKRKSEKAEFIENFKSQSRAIRVSFEDCDISHNEYEKEIILRKDTRYQERRIVRFSECKIKYVVLENELPVQYESPTLYMELINLRYKLYQQKETTIYIDEKEEEERFMDEDGRSYAGDEEGNPYYYFDIEFLGESALERPKAE